MKRKGKWETHKDISPLTGQFSSPRWTCQWRSSSWQLCHPPGLHFIMTAHVEEEQLMAALCHQVTSDKLLLSKLLWMSAECLCSDCSEAFSCPHSHSAWDDGLFLSSLSSFSLFNTVTLYSPKQGNEIYIQRDYISVFALFSKIWNIINFWLFIKSETKCKQLMFPFPPCRIFGRNIQSLLPFFKLKLCGLTR